MKNKSHLISIIVPIYNSELNLRRCINSIICQSYKKLEIILIDDGSLDNSGKICDEYLKKDERIIVVHKENNGVSCTRNYGINIAKGEFITFVDSDDYIDKNTYNECIRKIDKYNLDILKYSYYRELGKYKKKYNFSVLKDKKIIKEQYNNLVYKYIFSSDDFAGVWNAIIKSDIAKKIKFNSDLKYAEDFLFMSEAVMKSESIYVIDIPFYHYCIDSNSVTQKYDRSKIIFRIENIIYSYLSVLKTIEKEGINNYEKLCKKRLYNAIISKIGLVAYFDNFNNYQLIIKELRESKIYNDFLKSCGENKLPNFKFICYINLKLKILPKEIIKSFLKVFKSLSRK